jgi:hypothetical protein
MEDGKFGGNKKIKITSLLFVGVLAKESQLNSNDY